MYVSVCVRERESGLGYLRAARFKASEVVVGLRGRVVMKVGFTVRVTDRVTVRAN